jgi:hypothetical protein
MSLSTQQHLRSNLQAFNFKHLFIEELGWNNDKRPNRTLVLDGLTYTFGHIAEQSGSQHGLFPILVLL